MPFRTFTWSNERLIVGGRTPDPELRQVDKDSFLILRSFCYRAPRGDPDAGTVYVIPGEDFERPGERAVSLAEAPADSSAKVVVPADTSGRTDLASVPPVFWWLIASYGNHTRAALLHDALYVDDGDPPVPRRTADRLFLSALRESAEKAGPFRHWLMWAAVSAFGTMRYRLGLLFAAHVAAVWGLTIGAVAWAWSDGIVGISWTWWQLVLAVVAALAFLVLLGSFWRAGVDLTGGWLVPTLLTAAVVLVPLAIEWPSTFRLELSPFTLLVGAAALTVVGPLWGFWVDPTLRGWLWPTAVIALPLALVPAILILAALVLVWLIDLGAAIAAAPRTDELGEPRGFELPAMEQNHVAL
ncbi:MAG TPA: DUF1353 domain-containing protein [Gaiellaceae bacterium]|nr:DUF1353 domain-containing protein [Gaiellaceae bacterium]